jgi:hypothetical protein
MTHLILTPEQYEALIKSDRLYMFIDYSRFNDPTFGFSSAKNFWIVYLKVEITPTRVFDAAWDSRFYSI